MSYGPDSSYFLHLLLLSISKIVASSQSTLLQRYVWLKELAVTTFRAEKQSKNGKM
jgi:hypothetical protein